MNVEEHQSDDVKHLILKKRCKTKLVLKADSDVEYDGWMRTIRSSSEPTDVKPRSRYENVEIDPTIEKVELVNKVKAKVPVPTPRTSTPSRENSLGDMGDHKDDDDKEVQGSKTSESQVEDNVDKESKVEFSLVS